jgi:hypothetical protein
VPVASAAFFEQAAIERAAASAAASLRARGVEIIMTYSFTEHPQVFALSLVLDG